MNNMPQKAITPGEQSKVTGVRLPRSLRQSFEKQSKKLKELGYPNHLVSMSALIREIVMEYGETAADIFQRKNPRG
jgi:hypothetical protein